MRDWEEGISVKAKKMCVRWALLRSLARAGREAAFGAGRVVVVLGALLLLVSAVFAQGEQPSPQPKKINQRPGALESAKSEPFDGVPVEKLAGQCIRFETEAGVIELEMLAEAAPETVRNFLNLVASGAFETTTFSRVVKGFVVQGGNLSTSEKWGLELARRAARKIPDEPNYVKHVRGIVSMARPDEPNSASTHFFILLGEAAQLDGKFAAFGRVFKGMEVVEAINQAPVEGEKPLKPVRITRAVVQQCKQ
ncbi:MAG TPA: peptidylprolyl isomerase [Pyrinomonadaceae bacterium]|jgi:peptidyl-prolyl cis-trans isomerase B (cyclophilin B)